LTPNLIGTTLPDGWIKVVPGRDNVYIRSGQIPFTTGGGDLSKRVWVRIDRYNTQVTLREVHDKIREIQEQNPDLDVFWDGDEYAICSRPKTQPEKASDEDGEVIDSVR
jgi:hypothetical protein